MITISLLYFNGIKICFVVQCLVTLQMGFGTDIDSMVYGDLENDAELEAELRALQGEDNDGHSGQRQGGFGVARGLCCIDLYCSHDITSYRDVHKALEAEATRNVLYKSCTFP